MIFLRRRKGRHESPRPIRLRFRKRPSAEKPADAIIIPLRELERRAMRNALKVTNGSVGRAAKALGIGRATLYRRLGDPAFYAPYDGE